MNEKHFQALAKAIYDARTGVVETDIAARKEAMAALVVVQDNIADICASASGQFDRRDFNRICLTGKL